MCGRGYIINKTAEFTFVLCCLVFVCLFLSIADLIDINNHDVEIQTHTRAQPITIKHSRKLDQMIRKETTFVKPETIASEVPVQEAQTIEQPVIAEEQPAPALNRWGITYISEEELSLLAKVIYLEGHNTGLDGCQKVAVVIFNRFLDGRFFGGQTPSLTSVMSAPGQFSVYWRAVNDASVVATDQEYLAIDSLLNGTAPEEIINGGWLYFNGDGRKNYFR